MLAVDFPGSHRMVDALSAAVDQNSPEHITRALRSVLCDLIRDPEVQLPSCCYQPEADRYARRELYRSERQGFSVTAMTWGPGQGTPIHDHDGMWCVEGVWHGTLEITPFERLQDGVDRFRFESRGAMNVGPGSAGSLIPPHEYHTIRNTSDSVAVTVHVYSNPMMRCSIFQPASEGWFTREERSLSFDPIA